MIHLIISHTYILYILYWYWDRIIKDRLHFAPTKMRIHGGGYPIHNNLHALIEEEVYQIPGDKFLHR